MWTNINLYIALTNKCEKINTKQNIINYLIKSEIIKQYCVTLNYYAYKWQEISIKIFTNSTLTKLL